MKKLLCLVLALTLMLTAVLSLTVSASDQVDSDHLVITVNGQDPVSVAVGNEFIFRVGLYAGLSKILNGQVALEYDPDLLEIVRYEAADASGSYSMEAYCFPKSIYDASIVLNVDNLGEVNYNFTKAKGVAVFDDPRQLFAQFRFKATAPGTTDITHVIQYMTDTNDVRVFNKDLPNEDINPYTVITIEPSFGCVGDADGDYQITILDATMMQRAAARAVTGLKTPLADVNGDKAISLKDAVAVRQYLAGLGNNTQIGTWLFASEA